MRVTKSSANLYLYYFIVKCNLFIKILQRGKNTKNLKFVQNYKFPKNFQKSSLPDFRELQNPEDFSEYVK